MQIFYYFCSVKNENNPASMANKKYFCIFFLRFGLVTTTFAGTKWDYLTWRNEIRVGWGDQLFESLMWHNPTSITTTMPEAWSQTYHENYRHHQHLWAEYQYRFK